MYLRLSLYFHNFIVDYNETKLSKMTFLKSIVTLKLILNKFLDSIPNVFVRENPWRLVKGQVWLY